MRGVFVSAAASVRVARASRFLELERAESPASAAHPTYLLTPSALAATRVIASALGPGQARLSLRRGVLDLLALELAKPELIARGVVPLSRVGAEALAAQLLDELERAGTIGRFARVRDQPGMPSALARTLSDLSLAGVEPAQLRAGTPELAAALQARRELLHAQRLIDRAGVLELAAARVERGGAIDPRSRVVLLDVSLAHRAEQRLACALLRHSAEGLAIMPAGDERAIAELCEALCVSAQLEPAVGPLARVQTHVFERAELLERAADTSELGRARVQILSAPGEGRECVEAARVLLDAARAGTPFERMAVLMRRALPYRAQLEEALARAGIPAFFAEGVERPDPSGRALLALLRCKHEGLSASALCEYLSLDVMPEQAGEMHAPRRFERLIEEAHVIGGRARFERRLRGLHNELAAEREPSDNQLRKRADLEALCAFALPLLDRIEALPARASWGEWLSAIEALARAALARPARALEELMTLQPLAGSGPVTLDQVLRVLGPALRELQRPAAPSAAGCVLCAEVEHARGLSFDVVCVLGLAEKVFPSVVREDPLLLDGARREVGSALETNEARTRTERLMLRLALGAAEQRIALCYPRMDLERGRPRVPSFYGLEALRAAEGELPSYEALMQRAETASPARLGWPAPLDPARSIDVIEHDLASLRSVLASRSKDVHGSARYLLNVNPHLGRALRFRAYRWGKKSWWPADGQIDPSPAALARLQALRLSSRAYAPTALELYAQCPYRFYVHAVLGLRARATPAPIEDLSPLAYGALVHDAIEELFRSTVGQWPLVGESELGAARKALAQAIARVSEAHREKLAPAVPRVFDDAVAAIARDLQGWLERLVDVTEWQPLAIEAPLSAEDASAEARSARSLGTKLENGLRVRGRIDLVEQRADEHLRATDFKTGKIEAPPHSRVFGGAMLQPLVYALALEQTHARVVDSGRLVGVTAKSGRVERVVPLDVDGRTAALEVLTTIDRAIGEGFLPAAPQESACERCDLIALCGPYEEERVKRKDDKRLEALTVLRRMP